MSPATLASLVPKSVTAPVAMGIAERIGSEGVVAVEMGRKFVGAELKEGYWEIARKNLREAKRGETQSLFAEAEA